MVYLKTEYYLSWNDLKIFTFSNMINNKIPLFLSQLNEVITVIMVNNRADTGIKTSNVFTALNIPI
jgi:hypothetical protein